MKKSSLICTPLFGLVVGVYVLNPTNLLFTSSLVLSWWVARKTSKAIVRDYKYHLSEGPYTTHLIATRVPFGAALLSALLGYSIVSLALATLPFIMSGYYLYWRDINNVSDGDDLRKQRVRESERLPEHILDSYSKQGMHTAYANERLLRESLRKFNSFLDTEIDTQKRITIPDDAFTQSDLSRIRTEVNSIYEDFNGVAYRPQRFADIKNQIEKYSSQLQDVMNEENLKNN